MSKIPNEIQTLQRVANVSEKKAREQLFERYPDAEIQDLKTKRIAGKDHYVVTFTTPLDKKATDKTAAPMDPPLDGPVGENAAPADEDPGLGDLDAQIGDEEAHEDKPESHENHELDDIREKLDKLLDALGVTDPEEHPDEAGADLNGPPGGDPLPPPVPDPAGGAPDMAKAFSSLNPRTAREITARREFGKKVEAKYASHRSAIIVRDDASKTSNQEIIEFFQDATTQWRVAAIDRDTKRDADQAVIALVRS